MTAPGSSQAHADLTERLVVAYRRRGSDLFAFAYRLCGSVEGAEDAVHEAFVRMLEGRCRVDPRRGDLETLLFGVVRNVVREARRRDASDGRHRAVDRNDASRPRAVEPEDVLAVRAALDALSASDREVVVLASYHGFTPKEIAVALGVNAVVVRVRLHRARARLRRLLLPNPAIETPSLMRRTGHGG